MLDVLEANELLERAEELCRAGHYYELDGWLRDLPTEAAECSPDFLYLQAKANMHLGKFRKALALVSEAYIHIDYGINGAQHRRYVNLRGVIMLELGQVQAAEECFAEVAWQAHAFGDRRECAISNMNLGVAADVQCEWESAVVAFTRAIGSFEQIGESGWIARCRHNLGMTYRQLGQYTVALMNFDQALTGLTAYGARSEVLRCLGERALLFQFGGDHDAAAKLAASALMEATSIADYPSVAELLRVNGIIKRASEDVEVARGLFVRGLRLARRQGSAMLEAELLEEIAMCEVVRQRPRSAEIALERAARIFVGIGAAMRARAAQKRFDACTAAVSSARG